MKKIMVLCIVVCITGISCKKIVGGISNSALQQYFETNILNSNFEVSLATDNGTDLTAQYSGETFILLKTDLVHGPMKATKNGIVYEGTWSVNEDYSQLIITLPNPPDEFKFLTRSWRFTNKTLPTLKFAPWGSTEAIVLNMTRQ